MLYRMLCIFNRKKGKKMTKTLFGIKCNIIKFSCSYRKDLVLEK